MTVSDNLLSLYAKQMGGLGHKAPELSHEGINYDYFRRMSPIERIECLYPLAPTSLSKVANQIIQIGAVLQESPESILETIGLAIKYFGQQALSGRSESYPTLTRFYLDHIAGSGSVWSNFYRYTASNKTDYIHYLSDMYDTVQASFPARFTYIPQKKSPQQQLVEVFSNKAPDDTY